MAAEAKHQFTEPKIVGATSSAQSSDARSMLAEGGSHPPANSYLDGEQLKQAGTKVGNTGG